MGEEWRKVRGGWAVASLGTLPSQVATGTAANALAVACSTASYQVRPQASRFFSIFSWLFGRAPWIPGVQTVKTGEKLAKDGLEMGEKCVRQNWPLSRRP